MNRMIFAFRSRMDDAATRRATRHLDNHMRRDIGLPERPEQPAFPQTRF